MNSTTYSHAPGALPKILMVDDQPANLFALQEILRDIPCEFVQVGSGMEGLSELMAQDFAVVLVDVYMPGMSGIEMVELMRKRQKTRSTPVIFQTAADRDMAMILRGYAAGAADFLFKPLEPAIVCAKVTGFLQLYALRRDLKASNLELRAATAAQKKHQSLMNALLDNSPALIHIKDNEGHFVLLNDRMAKRLNVPLEEALGRTNYDFVPREKADHVRAMELATMLWGELQESEETYESDGVPNTFLVQRFPIPGLEGGVGVGVIATDITQRLADAEQLRLQAEKIAHASASKSEFLSNMSHELRTPLNAIIGFSNLLLKKMYGEINAKQTDYLTEIASAGEHLLLLINGLLDIAKIESGQVSLNLTPIDLPASLEAALAMIGERAANNRIAITVHADPALREWVADGLRLKQILLNLLSNAVKFTPEGGAIAVTLSSITGGLKITVSDSGCGIAPDQLEAVFDRYRQLGDDRAKHAEGTGLGLALARALAELHGGTLFASSAPDQGATFTLCLPALHLEHA